MQDITTSPVRNRRRVVDTSNTPSLIASPWSSDDVFTSALSTSHSAQRRLRSGSTNNDRSREIQALEGRGWQDATEEDEPVIPPVRSKSRERTAGSTIKSLAALVFHPLTPPTEAFPLPFPSSTSTPIKSRHSHDVTSPFSDGSINRRRNLSDGNYDSYSKAMAGLGLPDGKANPKDKGKGKMMDEHREVIVHEVQPTDSLAGVALKYGVQIADIRKANKLWASDSIHLRKTLYIPVEVVPDRNGILASVQEEEPPNVRKVNGASENGQPQTESQTGWTEDERPRKSRAASSGSEGGPPSRGLEPRPLAVATIRRVPASELSFFPPPTTSQRDASPARPYPNLGSAYSSATLPNGSTIMFPSSFSSSSATTAGMISSSLRGLPSLFNTSLPTLPTISSPRISFSSEGTSEQSSDVEMDNLGWQKQSARIPNGGAVPGGKSKGRLIDIDWSGGVHEDVTNGISVVGSVASTIRPVSMTTQLQGTGDTTSSSTRLRIRNQQPAPSPMMALPVRNAKPP